MFRAGPTFKPAPAPAEVKPAQPPPSMKEAAHARPSSEKAPNAVPIKSYEAQKVAAELREFDQKNPNPEDPAAVFRQRMTAETSPLNQAEQSNLNKIKGADGQPAPEVKQVLQFEQYANVQSALQKGQTLEQACKSQNLSVDQYKALKGEVMGNMAQMKVVQEVMPGLSALTPEEQQDYVENYLGANPAVRAAVIEKARAAAEKAAKLAEAPGAGATAEQGKIDAEQNARIDEVNRILKTSNGQELKADDLQDALDQGDVNGVKSVLYRKALQGRGVTDPVKAEEYLQRRDEIAQKEVQLAGMPKGAERTQLEAEIGQLKAANRLTEADLKITNDADRQGLVQKDAEAYKAVYGRKTRNGSVSEGMDKLAQAMVDAAEKRQTLEGQKKVVLTTEQQGEQDALRREVANILNDALVDVLVQQQDELRQIQDRKILADADAQEKAGQHAVAQAEQQLVKQMGENGVRVENGKRIINRKALGEKARYYGEHDKAEATPRLIMKDILSAQGSTLTVTDDKGEHTLTMGPNGQLLHPDGTPYLIIEQVKDVYGNYKKQFVPGSWDNIPLSSISGQSKNMLDTLVEKHGPAYEQRFLLDYNMARMPDGIRGIVSWLGDGRDLNLSKAQKGKLVENFGADVLKAAAEKAMGTMNPDKLLREKGIKMDYSWLMTLLMLLSGLGKGFMGKAHDLTYSAVGI